MSEMPKLLRRVTAIVAVVLLALMATAAAALAWYDGERLKVLLAEQFHDKYGVAVSIDRLERSYSLRPRIDIRQLRIANAAAAERTLVEVRSASFKIRPWTLLFDPLTLENLEVDGVTVTVPVDESGARYWDPLVEAVSDWFYRFDWSVREFNVTDVHTESRNLNRENELLVSAESISGSMPRAAKLELLATGVEANLDTALPLRLNGNAKIDRLALAHNDTELPVTLSITGTVQDRQLSVELEGGNLLEGDPAERDPVQGRLTLGNVGIEVQGSMSRDDSRHLDMSVGAMVRREAKDPDLEIAFQLSDPEQSWHISSLHVEQGDSTVSGEIVILNSDDRRVLNGGLEFAGVTFPNSDADSSSSGGGFADLLPEGDLYPQLIQFTRKFDADFAIEAVNSKVFSMPFDTLRIATALRDGAFTATVDESSIKDGQLAAKFRILPDETPTAVHLQAELMNASLAALLGDIERLEKVTGTVNGELFLDAAGDVFTDVLESMSGEFELTLEDGQMPANIATKLGGNVFAALFASESSEEMTPIRCAIINMAVDQGVARPQRLVMELADYALYGEGELSIRESAVDLTLVPRAKDFSLIATRMPIRIHGPFDNITLDPIVSEGLASLLTPVELGQPDSAGCDSSE